MELQEKKKTTQILGCPLVKTPHTWVVVKPNWNRLGNSLSAGELSQCRKALCGMLGRVGVGGREDINGLI